MAEVPVVLVAGAKGLAAIAVVVPVGIPSSEVEEQVTLEEARALGPETGFQTLASVAKINVVGATLEPLSAFGSADPENSESM